MKSSKLPFEYILTRKNVKNINCRIKSDGIVYISASKKVSVKYIEEFLFSKKDFIIEAIEKTSKKQKIEFKNNNEIKILNNIYTLKILESEYPEIFIKDNLLIIKVHDTTDLNYIEKLFNKFAFDIAKKIIDPLTIVVYNKFIDYNIPFPNIKYKKLKSMWGSCNSTKKIITFNTNLIFTNYDFINYVVLHEFAHLIHQNHQKEFYQIIEKFMPNYKKIRGSLYEK